MSHHRASGLLGWDPTGTVTVYVTGSEPSPRTLSLLTGLTAYVNTNLHCKVLHMPLLCDLPKLLQKHPKRVCYEAATCCGFMHCRCPPVCLSVCCKNAYTKMQFSQKQSYLELWSLLTTYRKYYMGFLKNPPLDP